MPHSRCAFFYFEPEEYIPQQPPNGLRLGWTVREEVGFGVINSYALDRIILGAEGPQEFVAADAEDAFGMELVVFGKKHKRKFPAAVSRVPHTQIHMEAEELLIPVVELASNPTIRFNEIRARHNYIVDRQQVIMDRQRLDFIQQDEMETFPLIHAPENWTHGF